MALFKKDIHYTLIIKLIKDHINLTKNINYSIYLRPYQFYILKSILLI